MGLFNIFSPKAPRASRDSDKAARLLVIPVDDSQHSLQALQWAVHNVYCADRKDQLHLLSVVPKVAGPYPAEVSGADLIAWTLLFLLNQRT